MEATRSYEALTRRGATLGIALGISTYTTSAMAADVWVDARAGAGGDGSMGSPFQTINEGLDVAMPGDTVHVLPGAYPAVRTARDGEPDQWITVVAEMPREAVVESDGTALEVGHDHHRFEGLVFDSGYGSGDGVEGGSTGLELVDVEVRRTRGDCVDLRNSSEVSIEACEIHHCVAQFDPGNNADAHGVTADTLFGLTIRDSEIYLVTGDALQVSPSRDPWDDVLVERTRMWSGALDEAANGWSAGDIIGENAFDSKVGGDLNGSGTNPQVTFTDVVAYGWRGSISNQGAFNVKEDVDFLLDRATVYDSEIAFRLRFPAVVTIHNAVVYDVDLGFRLEDGLEGLSVRNTTLGAQIGSLIDDAGGAPQSPIFANVLLLADSVPAPADATPSNMAVDGSVFVDSASHDYHLQMGSSPMDAGEALAEVTVDRDGVPRPFGPAHDIGAYEWTDEPPPGGSTGSGGLDGSGGEAGSGGGSEGATGSPGEGTGAGTGATAGETSAGAGDNGGGGCGCRAGAPPAWSVLLGLALVGRVRRRTTLQKELGIDQHGER
ncbi:MAG: right-handed parallel beta-helix repeat-containing protein [Myxococcota bacterium]